MIQKSEDTTIDQSKLFYRRALAGEMLEEFELAVDDMTRAFKEARRVGLEPSEQQRLRAEVDRMQKRKTQHQEWKKQKNVEKANEKTAEVQRMQGADLKAKASTDNASSAPGESVGYFQETDFSHWATRRIQEVVVGIKHACQSGGLIEIVTFLEDLSKVQAAVTTKKGKRSLYYEMDIHVRWKGWSSKGRSDRGEMMGQFRLYNVAHDTKFELGGDENTCYMYQLGWDQRQSGEWMKDLTDEAPELFDLVAEKVDVVIAELKKK